MKSKKLKLEEAKNQFDHCNKILKANEILWNDMWEAQRNPFLRIKEYMSKSQRDMRKPIIDAWLEAKKKYEALSKTQSKD